MGESGGRVRVALSATAVVCCLHDRVKRVVLDDKALILGMQEAGLKYDPAQHKIHKCACCENLFLDLTDIPRLCDGCSKAPVWAQAGPLAEPKGVVT